MKNNARNVFGMRDSIRVCIIVWRYIEELTQYMTFADDESSICIVEEEAEN